MSQNKPKKMRLRVGRLVALIVILVLLLGLLGYGGLKLYQGWKNRAPAPAAEDKTAQAVSGSHAQQVSEIRAMNPGDVVKDTSGFTDDELRSCFYSSEIDEKLLGRLNAMGYEGHENDLPVSEIRYVRVLYRNFENAIRIGELMVNQSIAQDVEDLFYDLYMHNYPIGKMLLPDAYGGKINEAFADNSTTGLCFGLSEDSHGEMHAYGLAVDINPLYNPMIKDNGKSLTIYPVEGQLYIDRTIAAPYYISADDYAYKIFTGKGFSWKGNESPAADYKHFEKGSVPSSQNNEDPNGQNPGEESPQDGSEAPAEPENPEQPAALDGAQDESWNSEDAWPAEDEWQDETFYDEQEYSDEESYE